MTKQEYIQIVHSQLSGVDPRDLSDAIVYLNEYFEEAGVENEQKVIEELGSPEKYAATIRADLVASVPPRIPRQMQARPASQNSVWKTLGILVLGICALPIALPLLIVVIVLIFVGVITLAMILLVFVMALVGAILTVGLCIFEFFSTLGQDLMVSLFLLGVVLTAFGAAILACLAIGWIIKVGFPALSRWVAKLYRKLRNREVRE